MSNIWASSGGEAPLLTRYLTYSVLITLIAAMLLSVAGPAGAQAPSAGEAAFFGVKKSDRVGKVSAKPDTKPDAVFSLNLDPWPGAGKITEIEVRALSGASGLWHTTPGKALGASYLGVAPAKTPASIINKAPGPLNLNTEERNDLLLFATGDAGFSNQDRQYQITVTYADGTTRVVPVRNEVTPAAEDVGAKPGEVAVRMTAVLKGISNYDAVGSNRKIGGDDKADGLFELKVEAPNKEITGIEIRNVDGAPGVWDTVPGSNAGPIGVALTSDPTTLMNNLDSSVAIQVKDRAQLNLYVADNGGIEGGKTNYRISVKFRDGEIAWCPAQKETKETKPQPSSAMKKVNYQATWLGFVPREGVGPYDAVGAYPGTKPDGKPDAVFGLDIEVEPRTKITGIEIESTIGTTRWGTTGTSPNAWGLAVAQQIAPTALLNKPDGAISIPLDGRAQFYIYAADPGDFSTTAQNYWMIVHLADGSSYKQAIVPKATSVVPGAPVQAGPERAKGIVNCEFRGFIADLVSPSRPGKDGYFDGTFILKLEVENKKLAKVEISSNDGTVRWSSDPKPPLMFLGVALYPNIYKLINEKGGVLNTPISGRRTLYLYAADNGMLSDPRARLSVTITFVDKSSLSTEVIK